MRWGFLAATVLSTQFFLAGTTRAAGELASIFDAANPSAPATKPLTPVTPAPDRLPIPSADDEAAAAKLIRDVYGKRAANPSAEVRAALATEFLNQSRDPSNSPASQYALLRNAVDLFARLGDAVNAMYAVDTAVRRFALTPLQELRIREAGMSVAAPAITDPRIAAWSAELALALSETALRMEQFDSADRLIVAAQTSTARARQPLLTSASVNQAGRAKAVRIEAAKASTASAVLARDPDNADANLTVGRYRCFWLSDWTTGLPRLAKGSDPVLRELALRSSAIAPGDPPPQAADVFNVASAWWEWADRQPEGLRPAVHAYAAGLYERSLPQLGGLQKTLATQRATSTSRPLVAELIATRLAGPDPIWPPPGTTPAIVRPPPEAAKNDLVITDGKWTRRWTDKGKGEQTYTIIEGGKRAKAFTWNVPFVREKDGSLSIDGGHFFQVFARAKGVISVREWKSRADYEKGTAPLYAGVFEPAK